MYVVTVERKDVGDEYLINGETQTLKPTDGSIKITVKDSDRVGVLQLKTTDDKLITDNLQSLADKIGNDQKNFFKLFKDTMADLLAAKDNIEIYANKGTANSGKLASEKLKTAGSNFENFKISETEKLHQKCFILMQTPRF